ncbi:MAG: DUF4388 domain-containing protein [Anaerolineales bacterium]|nr:DUF4388 domain-containing protein [Anaerolineales bacterium]
MAIKGNLHDFTLTQLLNLITLAQKSGTLVVERSNEAVEVFFTDGKLAYADTEQDDNSLAGILHKTQLLSPAQYQGIKSNVNGMSDKELGLLLINANYFSQQDIIQSLQTHFVDVVNRLFTWMEGFFRFESDIAPPDDKITVKVNLENLILEGSRQIKELEYLEDEIPTLEIGVKFVDRPGANVGNLSLTSDEWQVIPYIDPKNSLKKIALVTGMTDLEIRKVVYSLVQAGVVEMVRPEMPEGTQPPIQLADQLVQGDKEDGKSLLFRIIDRIKSL